MYQQKKFSLILGTRVGESRVQGGRIQVSNQTDRSCSTGIERTSQSGTNSGSGRIVWMWEIYYNSAAAKILRSSIGICGKI